MTTSSFCDVIRLHWTRRRASLRRPSKNMNWKWSQSDKNYIRCRKTLNDKRLLFTANKIK